MYSTLDARKTGETLQVCGKRHPRFFAPKEIRQGAARRGDLKRPELAGPIGSWTHKGITRATLGGHRPLESLFFYSQADAYGFVLRSDTAALEA